MLGCVALCGSVSSAAPPTVEWAEPLADRDGPGYPVSGLVISYPFPHPDLPRVERLADIAVLLTPTSDGYIGPVEGEPVELVRIGSIGSVGSVGSGGVTVIYASALAAINRGVRDALEREFGLIGHLVTPDAREIDYQATNRDLRAPEDTELGVLVWRAAVGRVRSIAAGERIAERAESGRSGGTSDPENEPTGDRTSDPTSNVNHPEHIRLRGRIGVEPGDLLTRPLLDEQIARLNRHPGRQVEAAVAPGSAPGEVVVDFLVNEPKQWTAYTQASNTGSESTDEWQYRFGFVHNQLTGRDDILRLDYITAGFDESHALLTSYSFDLGPRARATIRSRWNEYTAADVGLGFENFLGEGLELGAEIALNVYQDGDRFVDLVGGVRFESIEVENRLFLIEGDEDFFLPFVGARWERATALQQTFAEVIIEGNLASVAGTDSIGVQRLGRFGVDDEFATLRASWSHTRFLEPWFDPAGFRGERGADAQTLAHELALSVRVQHALGYRLVPNFQSVVGGFSTVRGYDESVAVGDNAIIASAEYRYHFGRAGSIAPEPATLFGRPFRSQRTRPYGGADWDLIAKAFIDAARVTQNDAPFFELDETPVGVGLGAELRLKRNITVRLDYGLALTPIGEGASRTTEVGDSRLHFSATLLF